MRGSGNNRLSEIAANWLPRRRRSTRFKGQSMVELALALPTLLLLMLGTIDVGRVFIGYIEMRNAVFEGARYGSRVPTDTTGIKQAVFDHGVPSGTHVADPTFGGQAIAIGSSSTITVTATRTFTPITIGFLNKYFGIGVFNLKATATMQVMT
ncbi:MAG TPA: TadE/TadG family type IV pilus assembly protein [Nitrolancea sp.]